MKILIIGGVAGGATTAARLRRISEDSEIIMFERGAQISYANCGLPYYLGGEIKTEEDLSLQTPEGFGTKFKVAVRNLSEVTSIDDENHKVTVHDLAKDEFYTESYDKLVLSVGAKPFVPRGINVDLPGVFTLRNVPDTVNIKKYVDSRSIKDAVVIGGGFIGIEVAENLTVAGLKVTLIEGTNQLLAPFDYDMSCSVHNTVRNNGVNLLLNERVNKVDAKDDKLVVSLANKEIETSLVIVAIGVSPDTKFLTETGINLTERGLITVNDKLETSAKDVYAVGDAIQIVNSVSKEKGFIPLAGPANRQARLVADIIMGSNDVYEGTQGSSVLKVFNMTAASTGLNEKACIALKLNYGKSFTVSADHASYYPGATKMDIKVLYEKETGVILGAQVIGEAGVDKRCDVLALAIKQKMTAKELTNVELCYAPPFGSAKDPVNIAGYVITNLMDGTLKNYYVEDIDRLKKLDATFVDVREPEELDELGTIPGYINIPLSSIRDELAKIDINKPVYVTCQVGQRGYYAYRILANLGYNVYNLAGGYKLYSQIHEDMDAR